MKKCLMAPVLLSLTVLTGTLAQASDFKVDGGFLGEGASFTQDLGTVEFNKIGHIENTTNTDARQQLSDFVKTIQSATGQFAQATIGGNSAKPPQSGTFAFERPGKFSWKVTKPYEQLVLSDGKTVYQYDPDLQQVTERDTRNAVGASPASILFGKGSLEDNFTVNVLPQKDGMVWLRATPKVGDSGMSYIDIAFANNLPVELQILDAFGQTTSIKLRNLKPNAKIPATNFRFDPPKGVDRVRLN